MRLISGRRWLGPGPRSLWRDSRARGVAHLATGGVVASALSLVLLPLVTRFYAPDVYAQFALAMTVTVILFSIATGKYEQAIPLCAHTPDGDLEAWRLGRLAAWVAAVGCGAAELLVLVSLLVVRPDSTGVASVLVATPPLVFLTCLGGVQSGLLTRQARYRAIAFHQTLRICLMFACQAVLGWLSPTAESLLLGFGISLIPSSVSALAMLIRAPSVPGSRRDLARSYRDLPLHQAPTALMRALEVNISLFVLAATFGDYLVGLYAIAIRLVVSPAILIASSVNTVYLREAPRLDPAEHGRLYRRLTMGLGAAGVALTIGLAVAAGPIADILGPDWQSAKSVIYASLPLGLATFVGALPSSALLILRRTRELLLTRLAITIIPNIVILACFWGGVDGVLTVFVSSMALLLCVSALAVSTGRHFANPEASAAQDPRERPRSTPAVEPGTTVPTESD